MKQKKKYFLLNKDEDFRKGRFFGLRADDSGIRLEENSNSGVYYSGVFDSLEKQTVWHRLLLEGSFGTVARARMQIYASDERQVLANGAWQDVEALIRDENSLQADLDEGMSPCLQAEISMPEDALLHQVKGRYLWFRLELEGRRRQRPVVRWIKISFPKDSWISYLPGIYREDRESASFLERYLGIFQSVYEDMTAAIDDVPRLLNPATAGQEHLQWLSEWLDIENSDLWNEKQMRYLISNAVSLYQMRGTVWFLKEIFRLYTGKVPYVIERSRLKELKGFFDDPKLKRELEMLYSSSPYEFTVLVDAGTAEDVNLDSALRRLADMTVPAGMECQIAVLKPYIFLDQYSYLGINSVLGQYRSAELDGTCAIPFTTIAEK